MAASSFALSECFRVKSDMLPGVTVCPAAAVAAHKTKGAEQRAIQGRWVCMANMVPDYPPFEHSFRQAV